MARARTIFLFNALSKTLSKKIFSIGFFPIKCFAMRTLLKCGSKHFLSLLFLYSTMATSRNPTSERVFVTG